MDNLKGIVTKKVNGYYSVSFENNEYLCKLKGLIKRENDKSNCITGDIVEFSKEELVITSVLPRKNIIMRPLVANIDYLLITFSAKNPNFDFDRFSLILLNSFFYKITPVIVINKCELLSDNEKSIFQERLNFITKLKIPIFFISTFNNIGISELELFLKDKVSALAGPSGAGKSSLMNLLQNKINVEVGDISTKIERGKHTTKGTTLLPMNCGGFIIDTPGFSNIDIPPVKSNAEYIELYPDILILGSKCGFKDCVHINEPNCNVKQSLENKNLSQERYDFYLKYYPNITFSKKYKK